MQLISLQDIVQACLDGIKEDRLAAPYVSEETPYDCQYIYPDGTRCAIGLVFDDQTMARVEGEGWNSGVNFQALVQEGIIGFLGTHVELETAMEIQEVHDNWVGHGEDPGCRRAFMEVLERATALTGAQGTA